MISKRKSSREQATRRWSNGSIRAARRKHQKKSNVGPKTLRSAASTNIRKSASSSAKRSKNSGSIRQRQQRSSGLKSPIESLTRSKRRRSHAAQGRACLVRELIGK